MDDGYCCVWEFHVREERRAEFERRYGRAGDWARLFRRADGYLETLLLADRERPGRYLTVDRWRNAGAYRDFRAGFAEEYAALDRECEALTAEERPLGEFRD